jgi:ABC-type proline/glycine betaine transport system substrate-binding protein
MTQRSRGSSRTLVVVSIMCFVVVAACTGGGHGAATTTTRTPPTAPTAKGPCGDFSIAYDPANGYEASAFIVGSIAATSLHCHVTYVKTTSRKAWEVVASGKADVYLDAYGMHALRHRLTRKGGPVTVVGPNGVQGSVDMLVPEFMGRRGLASARDLADVGRIGWGLSTPAITTVPELLPLARAFVDFQHLDYEIRNFNQVEARGGMGGAMQQARQDDARKMPNVYLVEGPSGLLGDRPGQRQVEVPDSASQPCVPSQHSTLCSFSDFKYVKIANSAFAASKNPAFSLVFNYRLDAADTANILELVTLSGYHVGPPDVASWLNTHRSRWRRWLP